MPALAEQQMSTDLVRFSTNCLPDIRLLLEEQRTKRSTCSWIRSRGNRVCGTGMSIPTFLLFASNVSRKERGTVTQTLWRPPKTSNVGYGTNQSRQSAADFSHAPENGYNGIQRSPP